MRDGGNSALYFGSVWHRRHVEGRHAFRYPLVLFSLALSERPQWPRLAPLFADEGRALFSFRREDHLPGTEGPLDEAVRDLVEARDGRRPTGPVDLLTLPRAFGLSFNPVSFYYCWDPERTALEAVVAEVTNTPWDERHCYVLPASEGQRRGRVLRFIEPKRFHVSPFQPMELDYAFAFGLPGPRLGAAIACHPSEGGPRVFDASIHLERLPLTRRSMLRAASRGAFQSARNLAGIYFEALRTKLRGAPYYPHPERSQAPLESLR
ncbi:MAG: DUF1365 domain-containing protein [Myxococcota bacterium]|nr:DUF1365 domain-containing protein [Myxococcota bacterium]